MSTFQRDRKDNTNTNSNQPEKDSPGVNLMPPSVFFSCLVLGVVLELLFPWEIDQIPYPALLALGMVVGGAGFAFMIFAHELFQRKETGIPTNQPATELVTTGAYRFSRNPMYVGGSGFFLGIGIIASSYWVVVASIPLILYLALYVIPSEEAYMKRSFGDSYEAYCRKVRRWL